MKRASGTKGEKTKKRLLEAALPLFAQKGFHETSFQDIADRAKISQAAVLYHFKNRLGLVADAIHYITAHNHAYVDRRIKPTDGGLQRIKKYTYGNMEWAYTYRTHTQVLLLLYSYACNHPEFKKIHIEYEDIAISRIEEHLYSAQRERQLKTKVEIPLLGQIILGFKMGAFTHVIRPRGSKKKTVAGYQRMFESVLSNYETS